MIDDHRAWLNLQIFRFSSQFSPGKYLQRLIKRKFTHEIVKIGIGFGKKSKIFFHFHILSCFDGIFPVKSYVSHI